MSNKIYLIDGAGYIFRAYYALLRMNLTSSFGQPTGAIFGFANMIMKLIDENNPEYLAVIFDLPGPTFRNEIYQDYKANRTEAPEDLVSQFPRSLFKKGRQSSVLKVKLKPVGIKCSHL